MIVDEFSFEPLIHPDFATMAPIVREAARFAAIAHRHQFRKVGTTPYITHPLSVRRRLLAVVGDRPDIQTLEIAALLHDAIEDTDVRFEDIEMRFGRDIAHHVDGLSNPSKLSDGNRRARHEIDLRHFAGGSEVVKTVRMADIMDNVIGVVRDDPGFAPKYLLEKDDYIPLAGGADPRMIKAAAEAIVDGIEKFPYAAFRKAERSTQPIARGGIVLTPRPTSPLR